MVALWISMQHGSIPCPHCLQRTRTVLCLTACVLSELFVVCVCTQLRTKSKESLEVLELYLGEPNNTAWEDGSGLWKSVAARCALSYSRFPTFCLILATLNFYIICSETGPSSVGAG